MESVKKTLKDTMLDMQTNFEERMASFEADLLRKTSSSSDIVGLAEEFAAFKTFVMQTLKNLQMQVSVLTREIDNMETRGRRAILLLHGVKEQENEVTTEVVTKTIKSKLMVDSINIHDVSRCHRLGRQPPGDKPRPILIEFQSVTLRDKVWNSKTRLKGSGVTVSEFLTRSRHVTFMAAREKFGISKCWTREGCIFIISADGSRHRISSIDDLNNFKGVETEKQTVTKAGVSKHKRTAASKK